MKKGMELYRIKGYDNIKRIVINKKKLFIIILLLFIIVCLLISLKNITESIKISKIVKQNEQQILQIQKEQEEKEKQIAEEEERKRQEKIPKLTQEGIDNIKNIYHSETKRAFLTFDDGPSTVTPLILDTLKNENIKATFFMLGSNVEKKPELVKRVYEEGHFIANHGYSHTYSQIYSSPNAVLDEYNKANDAIKNAIGVPEYNSHLFRFPGGFAGGKYAQIKIEAEKLLEENQIVHVDWNALTGDSETNKLVPENLMERLKTTTANKSSVVILMHDAQAKKVTVEILPQVIKYLREQGYEFKNFYEIIK